MSGGELQLACDKAIQIIQNNRQCEPQTCWTRWDPNEKIANGVFLRIKECNSTNYEDYMLCSVHDRDIAQNIAQIVWGLISTNEVESNGTTNNNIAAGIGKTDREGTKGALLTDS